MSPTIDICGYDYIFLSSNPLKETGKVLQGFRPKNRLKRIRFKALSNKKSGE
ncbi:conserved hypothetical protein [Vibrio crassostreae]|nr:conserved hypothetical protein [Vibrio crassostreae]